MIVKSYELNKINLKRNNIYLLYGENEGLKNKVINDTFKEFLKDKNISKVIHIKDKLINLIIKWKN